VCDGLHDTSKGIKRVKSAILAGHLAGSAYAAVGDVFTGA
jgi:hypothetical protein